MPLIGPVYCTREDVRSALDFKETARNNPQIDRAVVAGSRSVEGLLHRKFLPWTGVRYFDWPGAQYSTSWRLWLNQTELVSLTSITSGGIALTPGDVFLEPVNDGPPYDRIEMDRSTSASLNSGDTPQRSIAITGVWGYDDVTTQVATVATTVNASVTTLEVSDSSAIGVGATLLVDSERVHVTESAFITTTTTLGGNLTASLAEVSVPVASGSAIHAGESILIDGERMQVASVVGNTLTVKRAVEGSVLATHTSGATVYAPRSLTVSRAALGTTAASHTAPAAVYLQVIPGLVRELAIAEAIGCYLGESSGYAGSAGSGESGTKNVAGGLAGIRNQAYMAYGRKARTRAV